MAWESEMTLRVSQDNTECGLSDREFMGSETTGEYFRWSGWWWWDILGELEVSMVVTLSSTLVYGGGGTGWWVIPRWTASACMVLA